MSNITPHVVSLYIGFCFLISNFIFMGLIIKYRIEERPKRNKERAAALTKAVIDTKSVPHLFSMRRETIADEYFYKSYYLKEKTINFLMILFVNIVMGLSILYSKDNSFIWAEPLCNLILLGQMAIMMKTIVYSHKYGSAFGYISLLYAIATGMYLQSPQWPSFAVPFTLCIITFFLNRFFTNIEVSKQSREETLSMALPSLKSTLYHEMKNEKIEELDKSIADYNDKITALRMATDLFNKYTAAVDAEIHGKQQE
jgi:hypothetical protein